MIDTGAGLNLLKENMLEPSTPVNKFKMVRLCGINEDPVHTLGQIEIELLGISTILNIIPKEVPFDEDRVLESEFFRENNGKINYEIKCLEIDEKHYPFASQNTLEIPARSTVISKSRNIFRKRNCY